MTSQSLHNPILTGPIISSLLDPFLSLPADSPTYWWVDCTLGGGGHAAAILEEFEKDPRLHKHRMMVFDQDASAVARAKDRFQKEASQGRIEIFQSRWSEIDTHLRGKRVLGLVADLGFSSDQIQDPARGLSFQLNGPLDMRLDPTRGLSCYEYLSQVSEKELERVLREWGEERFSRRIASSIMRARHERKLPRFTHDLVDIVLGAIPAAARHGRIHPATRTFQALRIAVNDELNELDCLLERVILSVEPKGRVAILSFHSLEDRKVKRVFKGSGSFRPLTKKPIEPDVSEVRSNPRARSAKLRIAERLPDKDLEAI